jgi:uncharacterized RDD family membrane protein YckC
LSIVQGFEVYAYARWQQRFAAQAVDMLILAGVSWPLIRLAGASGRAWIAIYLIALGLSSSYEVIMHGLRGQTFGKMLVGIYVRKLDCEPIGWRNAFMRGSVGLIFAALQAVFVVVAWMNGDIRMPVNATIVQFGQSLAASPASVPLRYAGQVWFWSELVTMLLNKRRRAIHDFMGATIVVRYVASKLDVPSADPASS